MGLALVPGGAPLTELSGPKSLATTRARSQSHDSAWFRAERLLARALHTFFVAALVGAATGAGCLVTDPVPYEPAENIPPLVVAATIKVEDRADSDPWTLKVLPAGESYDLELTIRDYNLDDVLTARLITNPTDTAAGYRYGTQIPATGSRDRQVKFLGLSADDLTAEAACSRVMVAVSDRGFKEEGRKLYLPPDDADGNPITTVAIVQWYVWVSNGDSTSGPPVTSCGVRGP
jgi:hypothetical protein